MPERNVGGLSLLRPGQRKETYTFLTGDTTPDVRHGIFFQASTGGSVSITNFDNGEEGKVIYVHALSAGITTIVHGPSIFLSSEANVSMSSNEILQFVNVGTAWVQSNGGTGGGGSGSGTPQAVVFYGANSSATSDVSNFSYNDGTDILTVNGGVTVGGANSRVTFSNGEYIDGTSDGIIKFSAFGSSANFIQMNLTNSAELVVGSGPLVLSSSGNTNFNAFNIVTVSAGSNISGNVINIIGKVSGGSGAANSNFGREIRFELANTAGTSIFVGNFGFIWRDAPTESSYFSIALRNSASNVTPFRLLSNGFTNLGQNSTYPTAFADIAASTSDGATIRIRTGIQPDTGNIFSGSVWNDLRKKSIVFNPVGDGTMRLIQSLPGNFYVSTAHVVASNTEGLVSLVSTGSIGTSMLPQNYFQQGKSIHVLALGYYNTSAGVPGTLQMSVRIDTNNLFITDSIGLTGGVTNNYWKIDGIFTCQRSGATAGIMGQSVFEHLEGTATNNLVAWPMVRTTSLTLASTVSLNLTVNSLFSIATASNNITCTNLIMNALN